MASNTRVVEVYLELGKRRTFAGAIDWPGWCRAGRDEHAALQALLDAAPRYAQVLTGTSLDFQPPTDLAQLSVVERLEGNTTTDFGAPDASPSPDSTPLDEEELQRLKTILEACWRAFDEAAQRAEGQPLRKGPRGGGREVDAIIDHVLGADKGYLARLGWKFKADAASDTQQTLRQCRAAILDGLEAAARGELPTEGPRGGKRWTPRYFVRRSAWHTLDHAWEIEDRLMK